MASSAELSGTTAVVAGASRGIGREVCRRLAGAGADVWMVARDEGRLRRAAEEIGARYHPADASDQAAVAALKERVSAEGDPQVLVNATGTFELATVAETDPEMFRRTLAGNLTAPFLLIRAFLPAMLEAGRGHIVTLGSVAGRLAFPRNGAYSASKFGVRGLHAVLAAELKGTGVRATLVEPAATDTPLWDSIDPDSDPGLPSRTQMLSPAAVADAVFYAVTRSPGVAVPNLAIERS